MKQLLLALCATALLLPTPLGAAAAARPSLNLSDHPWPPYYMEEGGFAKNLLEICIDEAGYEPKFARVSIQQMYEGMRNGVIDAHVFSRRSDRESFLHFGRETLFRDSYRPATLATRQLRIEKLADFGGLRLGHLEGLRYDDEFLAYVQERRTNGQLEVVGSNDELVDALLAGTIDVFVNPVSTTRWIARERHAEDRITIQPYIVKSSDYYLTVSKTSRRVRDPAALLSAVDSCLAAAKADGRWAALATRYGIE